MEGTELIVLSCFPLEDRASIFDCPRRRQPPHRASPVPTPSPASTSAHGFTSGWACTSSTWAATLAAAPVRHPPRRPRAALRPAGIVRPHRAAHFVTHCRFFPRPERSTEAPPSLRTNDSGQWQSARLAAMPNPAVGPPVRATTSSYCSVNSTNSNSSARVRRTRCQTLPTSGFRWPTMS
jgi:hypothetical protein